MGFSSAGGWGFLSYPRRMDRLARLRSLSGFGSGAGLVSPSRPAEAGDSGGPVPAGAARLTPGRVSKEICRCVQSIMSPMDDGMPAGRCRTIIGILAIISAAVCLLHASAVSDIIILYIIGPLTGGLGMSTPQDVKARFLADHQALHPHPERIRERSFNRAASSTPAIWSRSATRCCAVIWSSGGR